MRLMVEASLVGTTCPAMIARYERGTKRRRLGAAPRVRRAWRGRANAPCSRRSFVVRFFQVCGRRSGGWPALRQAEAALARRLFAIVPLASFRDDTAPAIRRRPIDFERDIETARRAMRSPNQPTQKAATQLDALMEAAVDGIIVIDANGH